MFQSMMYEGDGYYRIFDPEMFNSETSVQLYYTNNAAAIITVYSGRKLPVVPNLARYYLWVARTQYRDAVIARDRRELAQYHSGLKAEQYYPCVIRKIEQLQFGKKR